MINEYKLKVRNKTVGVIKWNGKRWDLTNLPYTYQDRLENKKVYLLSSERIGKYIFATKAITLSPQDKIWAHQLQKQLEIENSPLSLSEGRND